MNDRSESLTVIEDGLFDLGDSIEDIVFHQNLNVFLVITKDKSVRVFEPHSSLNLANIPLGKCDPGGLLNCMYHSTTGGLIISGGKSIGLRQDHQGVLLLHTILQTQVASPDEIITLEILLSEALQLQQVFYEVNNTIENATEVREALSEAISEPLAKPCSNHKVGKWRTVCLTLQLGTLRSVCASLLSELRHLSYPIPALSLTSALYNRLSHLSPSLVTDGSELDKESMFSESARLATFSKWPHMNYKWALPDQMAQAGFFHQPNGSDDDRAMCFICNVCLVYWEPTDEPWSEHERHSPNCPYVKGEYTPNVPLSITRATSPAMTHSERGENIHRISVSNSKLFIASSTSNGSIAIWNVSGQLKKEITFLVDPSDSTILDKHFSDTIGYTDIPLQPRPKEAWRPLPSEVAHTDSGNQTVNTPKTGSNEPSSLEKLYPASLIEGDDFDIGSDLTPVNQEVGFESNELEKKEKLYPASMMEGDDMDFVTHGMDKNYIEEQYPFSHLFDQSYIVDSDNSLPGKMSEVIFKDHTKSDSTEEVLTCEKFYPGLVLDEMQCIDLEDILHIPNLVDESGTYKTKEPPKVTASSSSQTGHTESNGSKVSSNHVEFSTEEVSDELFAPPRPSHDVKVTSLCVFADPSHASTSIALHGKKSHRACLAIGVGLRRYDLFSNTASDGLVQVLNDVNEATYKDKPLDIMKLETADSQSDSEREQAGTSSNDSLPPASNSSSSTQSPKNFVPYLLVYDLSHLAQSQAPSVKQNPKVVNQGTSKKSTRKAVPPYYLDNLKDLPPYMFMNFPNKNKSMTKTISTTLPNDNSTHKKVPKCAQCIPLPHKLKKLKLQLFVDRILISPCGLYLLITLQQFRSKLHKQFDSVGDETNLTSEVEDNIVGGFILYEISSIDEGLSLQEEPIQSNLFTQWHLVPKEVVMIPIMTNEGEANSGSLAGVVCMDGSLRILSLTSLKYVHELVPQEKFNNITFCHSLERLCVTRENGSVVLMQVKGEDIYDDAAGLSEDNSFLSASKDSKSNNIEKEMDLQSDELLVNKGMTEENLDKCTELTQFQAGCPRFVATVPPCWSEVIQAQKKRRNPQHFQHQSEEVDSARTWRLESDRSTFDEHILDFLLPLPSGSGALQIGHIDIKLNLVSGVTHPLPKIQITLLKQNLKSTRKSTLPKPLDGYLEFPDNPVRTREFLLTHKAEILCGPVTVNQFVDLSGQAANLTLTSPELFACKGRSFLIHIKAIKSTEEQDTKDAEASCGLDLLPQYVPPQSSTFEKLSSTNSNTKKGETPKGCDIIHELTLTVHCCAKTDIPYERLQRLAMIEKRSFHSELISAIVCPSSSQHVQHRALDVLLWILSIHTASEQETVQRKELISLIQDSLMRFVRTCIMGGDRSLAHKVTKIILTALESLSERERRREFGEVVLNSLLKFLDGVAKCRSAGAVYWFFSLLNHVKWCDPLTTTDKVTELLSVTLEVLGQKMHPIHSLLQTKFGLYGMPFERELFDTFPPLLMKQSPSSYHSQNNSTGPYHHHHAHNPITPTNGNNNLGNSHSMNSVWNKVDCLNVNWNLSSSNAKNSFGGVLSPLGSGDNCDLGTILGQNGVMLGLTPQIGGLCGLFEVEPLHFSLHMASDGTKMERVFPGSVHSPNPYVIHPPNNGDTDSGMADNLKMPSTSMPPMQLHKAVEDMEQMAIKNHAVAQLLSKKATKSYLEKAKKITADALNSNSVSVVTSSSKSVAPNTESKSSKIDSISKPSTNASTVTASTSSTPTLSSEVSPENCDPPTFIIDDKSDLGNSGIPNEVLDNIVEGVANSLFSNSMLNSSLNLLANVTNDISDPMIDPMLTFESDSQEMPVDKVIDMYNNVEGSDSVDMNKDGYLEGDELSDKFFGILNTILQSDLGKECGNNFKGKKLKHLYMGKFSGNSEQETDKEKIEKSLAEIASIASAANSAKLASAAAPTASTDSKDSSTNEAFKDAATSGVPHQQLLSIPPQQMIVIEQMHSGARRFVILDFGAPIILTDVIIPACGDLVSLTIDIWLNGEETDGERLAVASDIGLRPLVLADLQPPPLCRFLKVTTLGRYGMVTSQCRIPVGAFYGHTLILPWYLQPSQSQIMVMNKKVAKTQLSILSSMVEDVNCRYSLACSKLKSLLRPHCRTSSGVDYPPVIPSPCTNSSAAQEKKILIAYQDCLNEQQHLNLIMAVMRRLQKFLGVSPTSASPEYHHQLFPSTMSSSCSSTCGNSADYRKVLESCSADQLSTIVQNLLNCLITLSHPLPGSEVQMKLLAWCGPDQAKSLIEGVCIRGPKSAQVAVVSLLARLCTTQPWWGEFLSSTLVKLFKTGETNHFPSTRVFALLTFLGQKSVQCGRGTHVIDAVLQALLSQLRLTEFAPPESMDGEDMDDVSELPEWLFSGTRRQMDPKLISWLLLFLSLCLDLVSPAKAGEGEKVRGDGGRWSWLTAESSIQKKGSDATKGTPKASRELLRKRLVHHKQQLVNLETATKSFGEVLAGLGNVINPKMFRQSEQVFKKIQKQHAIKHYKDLCSIQRNETNSLIRRTRSYPNVTNNNSRPHKEDASPAISENIAPIERVASLAVIKALVKLLMNTKYPCPVDTFLLTCKVIGGLVKVTRPCLKVCEFLNEEQLVSLLTHSMTLDSMWGSPWAIHALTCLLQDVLEGEHLYGAIVNLKPSERSETNVTDNNKGGQMSDHMNSSGAANGSSSEGETSQLTDNFVPTAESFRNLATTENSSHLPASCVSESVEASAATDSGSLNEESVTESVEAPSAPPAALKAVAEENLAEENNSVATTSALPTSVPSTNQANQSATAVSPPEVHLTISHFVNIGEEEGPESDESSDSDDVMEFLTEFQMDFNLPAPNSTNFQNMSIVDFDSLCFLPEPWYCVGGNKANSKDSRVGDLITAPLASQKVKLGPDHSTALDARLENGISLTAELRIHMMNAIHASRLCSSVSAPLPISTNWGDYEMYGSGDLKGSVKFLSNVFQNTLSQLSYKFEGSQMESLLEIWLSLNLDITGSDYNSFIVPLIPLYPPSISALLSAVARSQNISIRCWCLLLQTLTLCVNQNHPEESSTASSLASNQQDNLSSKDLSWMAHSTVSDRNFIPVLQKLLSGHYIVGTITRYDVVGSTLTNLLEDFLVRLEVRCDVTSPESIPGNNLKLSLLKLVMRLLEPDTPLSRGLGPLDIQKTLLNIMLSMHYNGLHKTHIPLTIINSVASVVSGFLSSNRDVSPGSPEQNSSVLGGLFASVLGSDGQQGPTPTRKMILCALLNLAKKLVEIPLESVKTENNSDSQSAPQEVSSGSADNTYVQHCLTDSLKLEQKQFGFSLNHASQTDEHKAMNPGSPTGGSEEDANSNGTPSHGSSGNCDGARGRPSNHLNKECRHNRPNKTVYIADSVLQNNETMHHLLHSLRSCECNSAVPINLISMVSGDVSETLGIGKTLSDALYQLLLTLNQKATDNNLLLSAILRYIRPSNFLCQPVFSEALFCFYTQVLDCENLLSKFAAMNGTELMWENLVKSVGTFGCPQTGLVSSVMNHLSPPLPQSTKSSTSHKRVDPNTGSPSTVTLSNPRGLYNFAPLATVTSNNLTARPANALVKPTQFFQRTKNPPWSYHLYPEENWVDLNLTLPCPILLHEVLLQPHTMSLGMCPSGVSLETGLEGSSLIPVTGLVCTAGLSCIHIVLKRPIVASIVVVRLHRSKDQSTLGLSHLKLLGTTTFKNGGLSKDMVWDQGPQKSSYWWLRLVDHCMFDVPGGFNLMLESGARVEGVMEAMITLLATSSTQPTIPPSSTSLDSLTETLTNNNCQLIHTLSSMFIENTTLALVSHNQDLLRTLVKCLLNHPLMMQPSGSSSVDAAVALLCSVSTTVEGIKLLVDWFAKVVGYHSRLEDIQTEEQNENLINPEILHCFAAILWNIGEEFSFLVTDSLFKNVYIWCQKATGGVKEGLDYVICSLCKVQPHLFTKLLLFMGFLTVIDSSSTSLTDDRKDRESEIRASCTDDMKESGENCGLSGEGRLILQDPSTISITPRHLQTASCAAQSPSAIHLMLDSGFPLLLVHGILEWCKAELLHQVESCTTPNTNESATDHEKASGAGAAANQGLPSRAEASSSLDPGSIPENSSSDALPPLSTNMVVHTLESLASMCSELPMKDWLGSGEGSVFWIPLLTVLGDPVMHGSEMSMRTGCDSGFGDYSRVEDATIRLMKECCSNHEHNQKLLAATLCHLIQRQNTPPPGGLTYLHSLSGFTRRLVLQILLETECVLVHVTSTFCLSQPPIHTLPPHSRHPKFGAGNKTRLMFLPVTTQVGEVIKIVTDWGLQGVSQSPVAPSGENGSSHDSKNGFYRKEIREVGLELVDKLSVAAGVTAKDKRMKDKGQTKWSSKGQKSYKKDNNTHGKKDSFYKQSLGSNLLPTYRLIHEDLLGGTSVLPKDLTLAQVSAALWHHGFSSTQNLSQLKFSLVFAKDACQESNGPTALSLLKTEPRPSMLSVFSAQGGLSILAQHMALLYPDTSPQCLASLSSKNGTEDKKEKGMDEDVGFQINMYCTALTDFFTGNSFNSPGLARNSPVGLFSVIPIPPHALGSFTLFLRLPGYAETLLTDNVKACCLLRLSLGVYDGIYEGDCSSFIGSLATLPFQVLELLLKSTPLTTDDGLMLRKMCLSTGVLHLILACLAALSHQDGPDVISSLQHPNVPVGLVVATARASCPQRQNGVNTRNDNDRCHYWAKGTGFGTGSTNQSWNVEQALIKQKLEEQHVVCLIKLLAQYINPGDNLPEDIKRLCEEEVNGMKFRESSSSAFANSAPSSTSPSPPPVPQNSPQEDCAPSLPVEIYDLFVKAGLIAKISSYLSNDSVLDMSRHIPLYQALMALVRGIAVTPSVSYLLLSSNDAKSSEAEDTCSDPNSRTSPSLPVLLTKMKTTVNTYMEKLKWKATKPTFNPRTRKVATPNNTISEEDKTLETSDLQPVPEEGENEDQSLSLLVPDIQLSTKVVEIVMERLNKKETDGKEADDASSSQNEPETQSIVDIYLKAMKPLQFDCYSMIVADSERGIRFVVPYHYENMVREAGEVFNPKRTKRLAQEAVTLSMSLPLSYSSSVFVRTDMDRLDVMKVLITGPEDTPYANGCFEFDVYFSNNYPNSPLFINLQTTGEKRIRFNPNLYQDGKVCLSILNTWHGRPEEKWNPQTSSLLQVLVSIQSLILVPEPYFNEPGYEKSRGSQTALQNSQEYDANIKTATLRWAILNQLRNPSPCFKEAIERHFWLKQKDILAQVESWISELEGLSKKRVGRAIPHHLVAIKKFYLLLVEDFSKMTPPKGFENVSLPSPPVVAQATSSQLKEEVEPSGARSVFRRNPSRHKARKTSRANLLGGNKLEVIVEGLKKVREPNQVVTPVSSEDDLNKPMSLAGTEPHYYCLSDDTHNASSGAAGFKSNLVPSDPIKTSNSLCSGGSHEKANPNDPGDTERLEFSDQEVTQVKSLTQCASISSYPKDVTKSESDAPSTGDTVHNHLMKDVESTSLPDPLSNTLETDDLGT